jgi:glycosyltransferase involved in cell wall biosynthesis
MGASIGLVLHDLALGGTERVAIRLANAWARDGRRVTIACGVADGPLRQMVGAGVHLRPMDPPIPRGLGSRRRLGRAAAALFAAAEPDVIFIPGNYHWPVLDALVAATCGRRPVIVAQISAPLRRADRGPLRQVIFDRRARRTMAQVDAAVALSSQMQAEADALFGGGVTTTLPLPALDDDLAPPVPIDADCRILLAAGRLVPEKGFELAVEALARLDDPRATLVILGEGPERAAIVARARELGVSDRVSLPGYVGDIRPWLDRSRLFLLTSRFEGYGAVVIEALAAGRPVVATACTAAVPELLDQPGHGEAVPVGDAAALARAISRRLASPPPDPAPLAASVQRFSLGPVARAYLDLFDRLEARRG